MSSIDIIQPPTLVLTISLPQEVGIFVWDCTFRIRLVFILGYGLGKGEVLETS